MRLRGITLGLGLLLAGCASPNPRYFSLERVDGPPVRSPAVTVVVRRVAVPHYLERDEIVRAAGQGRMRVSENDWWSEPLRQMLQRVLAADLSQRLPEATVLGTEALGGEGMSLVLAVERFEPDGRGAVVLDGYLALEPAAGGRVLRRVATRVPLANDRMEDQIAAMSQALATLADTAAAMLAGPGR